jgi:HAE1 family hydrophobic/amphiphilic exporter-1
MSPASSSTCSAPSSATRPLDEVVNTWRAAVGQLPDVISINYGEPAFGPGGRPIDLRLIGNDLDRLKAASTELQAWLNGFDGVLDLSDDLRPGKREYRIRLKPDAGVLGLDARQVADQLRAAFQGVKIDEFPLGAETYEVNLRLAAEDRRGPADLERFTVTGPGGSLIPLATVAEIEPVRGWARIHRIDGQRAVTLQGDVDQARANAQELLAWPAPSSSRACWSATPACGSTWKARARNPPRPAAPSAATCCWA